MIEELTEDSQPDKARRGTGLYMEKKALVFKFDAGKCARGRAVTHRVDLILEKYEFQEKIGEGSYGMVMKARDRLSGNEVAVKLINKSDSSPKSSEMINEVEILKTLDHPNIVKLLEIYESDKYIFMV